MHISTCTYHRLGIFIILDAVMSHDNLIIHDYMYIPSSNLLFGGYEVIVMKPIV